MCLSRFLIMPLFFFFLLSCHHNPDEVVRVNTNIIALGSVGQAKVGIQDETAVVVTQLELDDKLRQLIWLNSQTFFEIKNSVPRLNLCLKRQKNFLKKESFPEISFSCLKDFEEEREKLGVVAFNSEGEYRLIKKESFIGKIKQQKVLRAGLLNLQKSVQLQLDLCDRS